MLSATVLDLSESGFSFTSYEYLLLAVGFTGAFISAILAVKSFIKFIKNNNFVPFGIYRIVLGILYFLYTVN